MDGFVSHGWAAQTLGVLDIVAAVAMLWANQRITTTAGFSNKRARWALFRRLLYSSVAMALFALGIGRATGRYDVDLTEAIAQVVLLVYVIIFPILRALGWTSQDSLLIDGL